MLAPQYLAYFGGTFNPPHLAHHEILKILMKDPLIQKAFLVPTSKNPLKTSMIADSREHSDCLDLWLQNNELAPYLAKIALETREMNAAQGQPSYTVDTLRELKMATSSKLPWVLVLGSDNVTSLPRWKDVRPLLKEIHSVWIFPRGGNPFSAQDIPVELRDLCHFRYMNVVLPTISSTEIRKCLEGTDALQELQKLPLLDSIKQRLLSRL